MRVKEVTDLVGISVRTLHHYDEIGLLTPKKTTESGYRLYSDENLELLTYEQEAHERWGEETVSKANAKVGNMSKGEQKKLSERWDTIFKQNCLDILILLKLKLVGRL
jgi:DNA-binding transcriptional MerR regulator